MLGALMEKEVATPEYYPLSLNALMNACNQKSNREPVVASTRRPSSRHWKACAIRVWRRASTGRDSARAQARAELHREIQSGPARSGADLLLLLLRGPQTPGELRGRSDRLYTFDDLEAVESTLNRLAEMEFVKRLPRQPGSRESRWAQLLAGDVVVAEEPAPAPIERLTPDRERLAALEREVAELKRQFEEFRRNFE